jgi:hypothetical protein
MLPLRVRLPDGGWNRRIVARTDKVSKGILPPGSPEPFWRGEIIR